MHPRGGHGTRGHERSQGGATPPAATAEATAPVATHSLVGDITAIELQNINKAQGHFTYNVELVVAVRSLEPALNPPVSALRVRVGQSVPPAQRARP